MPIEPYAIDFVPGGSIGANPQPTTAPWETVKGYGGTQGIVFETAVAGTIQNATPTTPALFGWRIIIANGDAVGSKRAVSNGIVGGLPGFTRIHPMASLFAGVLPTVIRPKVGMWYIETDIRFLSRGMGTGDEFYWVMSPSWQYANGLIGASNGFGVVWSNTLGANFRVVVADATGTLLSNVDTGIAATVGTHFYIRMEYGFDGTNPVIRVLINDVLTSGVITGPLTLNTANKLGAFNQQTTTGCLKAQASASNNVDLMVGCVAGLKLGKI